MKVYFVGKADKNLKNIIKKSISISLEVLGQPDKKLEVCVNFVTPEEMKDLNNRTRNIDRVTDVLSYPAFSLKVGELLDCDNEEIFYGGVVHLGDMAICLQRAEEQAKEYDTTLLHEVSKLAVHSTLHLMGYDHIEDCDYKIMQPMEDKIREELIKKKVL